MKQEVLLGQVDYTVLVKIRDTDGAAATGLTEADIDIAYARVETDNDVTTADVTPAALAALTDAHTDWGFEEVSATDHPGLYRLDIADAVFASGAWSAVVTITGTGLDPCDLEFVLVTFDPKATTLPAGALNAAALGTGAITASTFAAGAINAAAIAADAGTELATALLDLTDGIETGVTLRKAMRLCAAVLGGVLSGAATTTITIKAADNSGTTRVTATVDGSGNRSALTLNL
jgi:hypothetical protein